MNDNFKLASNTDFDWKGSQDDRKSITGLVFSLGFGAIAWCSKKKLIIALSSTEAKYILVIAATCEAVWLRRLLEDLCERQDSATIIICDNR